MSEDRIIEMFDTEFDAVIICMELWSMSTRRKFQNRIWTLYSVFSK